MGSSGLNTLLSNIELEGIYEELTIYITQNILFAVVLWKKKVLINCTVRKVLWIQWQEKFQFKTYLSARSPEFPLEKIKFHLDTHSCEIQK